MKDDRRPGWRLEIGRMILENGKDGRGRAGDAPSRRRYARSSYANAEREFMCEGT